MKKFADSVVAFLKEEDGPTAVEYAVMLALIIVVCVTAATSVGTAASDKFDETAGIISN
ncbi:MAG: Flp family type IVb pilin [Planctomycetota bacterium]